MQSISVFLDIAKWADFGWKNTDVSRKIDFYYFIKKADGHKFEGDIT